MTVWKPQPVNLEAAIQSSEGDDSGAEQRILQILAFLRPGLWH